MTDNFFYFLFCVEKQRNSKKVKKYVEKRKNVCYNEKK